MGKQLWQTGIWQDSYKGVDLALTPSLATLASIIVEIIKAV